MQQEINKIINSILTDNITSHTNPKDLLSISKKILKGEYSDEIIHSFLEIGHFPQINAMFQKSELHGEWLNTLFSLVKKSKYSTGVLIQQRVKRYSKHTLFQTINGKKINKTSYNETWTRIKT